MKGYRYHISQLIPYILSLQSTLTLVTLPYFQKFVEGYVEERRCYLDRRVAAQRQGLGKFHTDANAGGASGKCIGASSKKKEEVKAEFKVRIYSATHRIAARLKPRFYLSLQIRFHAFFGGDREALFMGRKSLRSLLGKIPGILTCILPSVIHHGALSSYIQSFCSLHGSVLHSLQRPVFGCLVSRSLAKRLQEAVNRTKIVLKALESKVASQASCASSPGVTPTVATRTWRKWNQVHSAKLERRPASRVRLTCPRATTHAAPDRKDPINWGKDGNGTSRELSVSAILRRSTEEYGDRVGKYGGGGAKHGVLARRCPLPILRGSGTEGMVSAGTGGETATADAAVLSVQTVFRKRMFHRLVWAQRYLRRPTHAFSIFKRACRPCLLASANIHTNIDVATAVATGAQQGVKGQSAVSTAVLQSTDTTVGDVWPEAPGFNPSAPYHTHAADDAFFEYLKWRHQESTTSRGAKVSPTQLDAHGQAVGLELSSALEATPPSRTQGIHFFARKYAIHTEAMRSTLLNLHLPFIPGALDAAMDDLDSVIDAETSFSAGDHVAGSSHKALSTRSGVERARIRNRQQKGIAHRRQELSFASWYEWWVRHLPYDIGSPTYMLKTIRCAKTLHSAEVAAYAEVANT